MDCMSVLQDLTIYAPLKKNGRNGGDITGGGPGIPRRVG